MAIPKVEKLIGMEVYSTKSQGIGGVIRYSPEDFIVEEVLVDGSTARIQGTKSQVSNCTVPTPKHPYLLCVLIKRNKDTLLAIENIAERLGINTNRIHIAGIKDTKAVTAQHITIEGITAESVQRLNIPSVEVYAIGYSRSKLSPSYLLGNSFQVIIRRIGRSRTFVKERINRALEELARVGGVPNFFGHQRFGTTRPITHLVGKALIQGEIEKAAMIFLAKPSPYEHPESREARKILWETGDFKRALENFPKKLYYERVMLRHLAKRENDYIGAFRRLPKKLLRLFPQAYQAYIFNKFLSRRILFGLPLNKAEIGDCVVSLDPTGLVNPKICETADNANLSELNEAIKSGRKRLALPMVGFKHKLSQGLQGEIGRKILEEEGISLENFKVKRIPELSLKGGIRSAITPLNSLRIDEISRDETKQRKWKIKLMFMLHRGSYASVFLREIMKPRNPVKAGF
ncbi:MAG: tRNA pseudouridine(13) synthase TruD [Candidatus Bathyarchaeia archaeon]